MRPMQFIFECAARGIQITLDGGKLKVTGKLKQVTADYIRQHKAELIEALTPPPEFAGCHPVPCGNELGWRKSPDEQAPFSPITEEEPTHGACLHCKRDTGAMLTTPDGLIAWCCPDCFAKRAGECKAAA